MADKDYKQTVDWLPVKTLVSASDKSVLKEIEELEILLADGGYSTALGILKNNSKFLEFLTVVFAASPYLRNLILKHPDILDDILVVGFDEFCNTTLLQTAEKGSEYDDESQLMSFLRKMKSRIALGCALADLGGWWNGQTVTKTLSKFADACLNVSLDFILKSAASKGQFKVTRNDCPQVKSGLIVLAMGKHGACELNYSSDIDLILFYDEHAGASVLKTDPTTFFSRLAKQLVKLLQERTSDGYVFRVDLRLRPDPSSTPAVMPLEAGLIYYESYGQNWERAAMIKARPAAGDIEAGNRFLSELTPFIWRKYLDYAAIQDVHSIKRQIHAHKGHAAIATRGHNIKLGRGGIREIEFFAQTQQLIAGGRIPQLRTLRTVETINALHQQGWVDANVVDELTKAYWYLRDVEHRLQMVRDEQTHTLPGDEDEFLNIALMMGCRDGEEFASQLTATLQIVEKHYSSLFEASPELTAISDNLVFTGDEDDPQTLENLGAMGYQRPIDIMRTIKGWHFGRYPALRTSQARELLTELTPLLLQEFARTGRADETLIAMDRFISGLPAGIQLFALLNSNPPLLHLLTLLLSAAPRLADIITRRPHVFDGLLDPAFNTDLPDHELLAGRLSQFLTKATDYESKLNRGRIFAAEQKFLIGVRLLNGTISAERAGLAFSELAEVLLNAMMAIVKTEFESKHGEVDGGAICVLAMGRLGSMELTAGSDLDLIFLYDHAVQAEYSNGAKQLPASQYFTRLTQRLTAAMSAPTSEGVIYELDFRLRPSGKAGPLATHINSFIKYQKEQAWTWERQALTRARPVAGDLPLRKFIEGEISSLIANGYDQGKLKHNISNMRQLIEKEKGNSNPWDCKNVAGGLIDIEFIAQWIVLQSSKYPNPKARDSRAVILSARGNLIAESDCDILLEALGIYTIALQYIRACLTDEFDPENAPQGLKEILSQALGFPEISAATAQLQKCQVQVRDIFIRLIG
ncbi:MAG: bifunctional [glutamine synthetase] adenylyltransferase/[glutamine synthetase]-adenylyl-L-tyrosine phosphorylase [Rhizobiaceae bacterium]|nr:bifunctional [glutamine synthetase] adenylyltransferase/[glutamine synthetase]-adenylyl-L-tyrosine phosphorylase [Rhizobiaceae bacterium]